MPLSSISNQIKVPLLPQTAVTKREVKKIYDAFTADTVDALLKENKEQELQDNIYSFYEHDLPVPLCLANEFQAHCIPFPKFSIPELSKLKQLSSRQLKYLRLSCLRHEHHKNCAFEVQVELCKAFSDKKGCLSDVLELHTQFDDVALTLTEEEFQRHFMLFFEHQLPLPCCMKTLADAQSFPVPQIAPKTLEEFKKLSPNQLRFFITSVNKHKHTRALPLKDRLQLYNLFFKKITYLSPITPPNLEEISKLSRYEVATLFHCFFNNPDVWNVFDFDTQTALNKRFKHKLPTTFSFPTTSKGMVYLQAEKARLTHEYYTSNPDKFSQLPSHVQEAFNAKITSLSLKVIDMQDPGHSAPTGDRGQSS